MLRLLGLLGGLLWYSSRRDEWEHFFKKIRDMGVIYGGSIRVMMGNAVVAGSRSCEIDVREEVIGTASATDGVWETHRAGRKKWSVHVGYLLTTTTGTGLNVDSVLNVGTSYTLSITGENGNEMSGTATLTEAKVTATIFDLAKGSFVFTGNGPLSGVQP